jgi:hypothetical protein
MSAMKATEGAEAEPEMVKLRKNMKEHGLDNE